MAGAGWRQWVRERLPADVMQSYLQDQVVTVWASRAARTAGLAAPSEGMVSYLLDEHVLEQRDATAWRSVGPGAWVTPVSSAASYSVAVSGATYADLAGYDTASTGSPVVPTGRTLDVEWHGPRCGANSASEIAIRLALGGTVVDTAAVAAVAGTTGIAVPVKLAGSVVGAGVAVTIAVQRAAVTGTGTVQGSGLGPRLRYRIV